MRGTYRFYQGGRLIGESENLITDAGRRHVMRYLAGQEAQLAGSIAVGSGQTDPVGTDTRLTYEFDRSTIYLVSPSYLERRIIFKSTIAKEVVGSIYEVGLFSNTFASFSTGNPSRSLVSFEDGMDEVWSSGTYQAGNNRLGDHSLRLTTPSGGTVAGSTPVAEMDLSGYANGDRFVIAFFCLDSNVDSIRLRLRGVDPTNYYEATTTLPMQGYNVRSFLKSSLTKVGAPDFAAIDSIEIGVTAKAGTVAAVDFDGIRLEAFSPDIDNVLVSRSVLSKPIVKSDEQDMDVEYAIEVGV